MWPMFGYIVKWHVAILISITKKKQLSGLAN